MNLENVREELERLLALVQGWISDGEVSSIERDLALGKIRSLYEELRFMRADEMPAAEMPKEERPAPEAEPDPPVLEVIDLDEVILSEEPLPQAPAEAGAEPEPLPEPEPKPAPDLAPDLAPDFASEPAEPEPAPVAPAPEPAPAAGEVRHADAPVSEEAPEEAPRLQNSLFDLSEMPVHRRESRRVLMSLYGEAPLRRTNRSRVKPAEQPEPAEEPSRSRTAAPELRETPLEAHSERRSERPAAPRPGKSPAEDPDGAVFSEVPVETVFVRTEPQPESAPVLGEVIGADRRTLADTIAPQRSGAGSPVAGPIGSLRSAIGINDRFLLIGELFGGDAESYDRTIEALDGMESLDDCLIYVAENHTWNSNSDGAKLLFELLERKYGES